MSSTHPTDEQLLLHAEGVLADDAVDEHVALCSTCREAVTAAAAGRAALLAAPLLELPASAREEALAALPARPRSRRPGRRFLGVAVPLTALAAVVAVVGLTGGGDPERAAEQMAADDAQRDAPAVAMEAAPAEEDAAALRTVAGPAEEVAELLRAEGLDARVVDGAVEVYGAEYREVEEALRDRPAGEVEVRLR